VWAKLDCSFDDFLNVFPCNHAQGVPGDRVRALTMLCEMSGIQPIVLGPRGKERQAPIWELMR
jgi:L-fucose isomerase